MGANDKFDLIDMSNQCHRAVVDLLANIASSNQAVHGKVLSQYDLVNEAGMAEVQALLADQDAVVPLFDEWVRSGTFNALGVTAALAYRDFPRCLHGDLVDGTSLFRYYHVPDAVHRTTLPLIAMAIRPDGLILTVNEPHGKHRINPYDGVRSTK